MAVTATPAVFCVLWALMVSSALAQGPQPSPSVEGNAYVGASTDCFAADLCDFFFEGSGPDTPVPVLDLGSGFGDYPIGPNIISKDGRTVQTVDTAQGYKYTGPGPIPNDNQNQFYGNGAFVYARTFNQPQNLADYEGRCFLVPLSTVQFADGTHLLPNDTDARYPEPKRCVVFRSGGDSSGAIRGGECWPEGELARSWAAFEVAAGAAVRRALEEDARNVTACASDGPALQRVLAAEAAQLSAMLSGCPGNVSAYVFQRMVLGAQSAEARALELVLGDDVAEIPGRKLLGWLARLKRKAGRAVTTAVRTTGRVAGNVVDGTVEVAEDVGDYVKRHSCDIGCGVVATVGAAGCLGTYCTAADYANCILCAGGVAVAVTRCATDTCG